ncbi:hypothetical protein EYE40_02670 [Glaciihabitans arcticus]|uniref:Uncharacterized protein n=1 Tax=Glaciihabitans arcticus TaxID=2668039 RepID=A0A4Q9GS15_9MICO|nr:hypothetical protein [Glaciihabitans arcticus]TBN56388.1 hypothetical protein EYE40_02670 [Glaciihabitans arcticus]
MTDARGRLESDPFAYRVTKAGGLQIERGGRIVLTLGGCRAARLIAQLERAEGIDEQLLLAKATGHYKH